MQFIDNNFLKKLNQPQNFFKFLVEKSITFEEELKTLSDNQESPITTEDKIRYIVSPDQDVNFDIVFGWLKKYKNQAYFDILFDSNDIFSDRILESIYFNYLQQYLLNYIQQTIQSCYQ